MRGHGRSASSFAGDSWLGWEPDPARAAREADPGREPYASMPRGELLRRMLRARGGREWEFLQEYFLDRCPPEELALGAEEFIARHYGALGAEGAWLLAESVGLALRRRGDAGRRPRGVTGDAAPRHGLCAAETADAVGVPRGRGRGRARPG